jgi:hypothetical protein
MRLFPALVSWLTLGALHSATASAEEIYRWIQYVDGGLEARVATSAASCPDAMLGNELATMSVRADPDGAFPILVCALSIPTGTRKVAIGGMPLVLPKPTPERILLIGDTGCRISSKKAQACNDISEWPFRLIADTAAEMKPDLVIHVGDYYYRETACPPGKGCAGSPSGDRWDSWREDFFAPARPLLAAAPWVFVRGNHEKCGRGGRGWSRLLDAFPFDAPSACKDGYVSSPSRVNCEKDVSPHFVAQIGEIKLVIIDVAAGNEDDREPNNLVICYRPQFEEAASLKGPVWLAFHEPIWSPQGEKDGRRDGNATLALAARAALSSNGNVTAMLSGHIHSFEMMSYVDDLPVQIVSGHGGDELECAHDEAKCSRLSRFNDLQIKFDDGSIAAAKVRVGRGVPNKFGFSTMDRHDDFWTIVEYDIHANKRLTCSMRGRNLDCD